MNNAALSVVRRKLRAATSPQHVPAPRGRVAVRPNGNEIWHDVGDARRAAFSGTIDWQSTERSEEDERSPRYHPLDGAVAERATRAPMPSCERGAADPAPGVCKEAL